MNWIEALVACVMSWSAVMIDGLIVPRVVGGQIASPAPALLVCVIFTILDAAMTVLAVRAMRAEPSTQSAA